MEIKSIKKVRRVKYSNISSDDYMQRPRIKAPLAEPMQNQNMSYTNRRIYFDGKEVSELIRDTSVSNPQLLSKIASELEKFRKGALKRRKKRSWWSKKMSGQYSEEDLGVIFSLCDAYITRISELIKQRYDQTKDGISVQFDEEGQLILNGMNIHALVDNCLENMNKKSLTFLKGIRARLDYVLENKINSRNYDRIKEVVLLLQEDIDGVLAIGKKDGVIE